MSYALLLATLVAACPEQQAVLDHAARAIEGKYVDKAQATQIAQSVRDWAQRDRYADSCGDPSAFVSRLNRDLHAYDGHFHFEPVADKTSAGDDWLMAWRAQAGPTNAGVREVRVLEGNIGYLRLTTFYSWEIARPKLVAAFQLLGDTQGLVLDLRQNGGGESDTANHLVRALLGGDVESVQRIESRRGTTLEGLPGLDMPAYPHGIVVLVDRRSASASEFVAYSLQAAGRATVVGSRSAGAASMLGEPDLLPHGFQISIPDARPVNLKTGRNWDGAGVAPDMSGGDDPVFVARRILAGDVKVGAR